MEEPTFTAIDYNSLENKVIRDDGNKRILRCSEGNRIWYQLWITDLDMAIIEKYYQDSIDKKLIKAWWLKRCGMFSFMRRKVGNLLGKESSQYILNCVE